MRGVRRSGRGARAVVYAAALTALTAAALQLGDWLVRNGPAWRGRCVNHSGEPYACALPGWLARGLLSPFAWPTLALIFVVWLGLVWWRLRRAA